MSGFTTSRCKKTFLHGACSQRCSILPHRLSQCLSSSSHLWFRSVPLSCPKGMKINVFLPVSLQQPCRIEGLSLSINLHFCRKSYPIYSIFHIRLCFLDLLLFSKFPPDSLQSLTKIFAGAGCLQLRIHSVGSSRRFASLVEKIVILFTQPVMMPATVTGNVTADPCSAGSLWHPSIPLCSTGQQLPTLCWCSCLLFLNSGPCS